MESKRNKGLIVAIDGYSSTGKSSVAKVLAKRLGYVYIDTGAMYRAVTLYAMRHDFIVDGKVDESGLKGDLKNIEITFQVNAVTGINAAYLNGACVEDEIRGLEVADHVSSIAKIAFVREYLVELQREMGKRGGIVMDGRDIGSVVFPRADIKFFLTARPEVRAMRRYKELKEKGEDVTYEEVEENVKKRDYMDENRAVSPLKRVDDAVLIDNSEMTLEEEIRLMLDMCKRKLK